MTMKAVVLGVCFFGLAACSPDDAPDGRAPLGVSEAAASGSSAACPGNRWVGVTSTSGVCPRASSAPGGSWQVSFLFSTQAGTTGTISQGLRDFCAYDWVTSPTAPAPPAVKALPGMNGLPASAWLAPDCRVITPLAGGLADDPSIWTRLRTSFLRMTGALTPLPAPASSAFGSPQRTSPVRVAVVDSAVEGYQSGLAGHGQFGHGRAVGRAIRELSCPPDSALGSSPCTGMVSNHLALAHETHDQINTVQGGFFGTQSELALAIFRATNAWKANLSSSTEARQPRLVINLSVGWDSEAEYGGPYAGNDVATLPGPVRAVHQAITDAVCTGALVIVAAGNASGGPASTSGPMYPAAWEIKPAPTLRECRAFQGSAVVNTPFPTHSTVSSYQPLVYAVGGVDGEDLPLASTRSNGRPRLAAYGYHVTANDGASHTDILTGTSMSAATVSAIAATVWGYRPSLPPAEVMELIYGSAVSLHPSPAGTATEAQFCLGGGACGGHPIRRVNLCRAVTAACAGKLERCPASLPACVTPPAYAGENPSWSSDVWPTAISLVAHESKEIDETTLCADPSCAPDAQAKNKFGAPWVDPQPGWSGCDVCSLSAGTLYVSLKSTFTSWNSVSFTVKRDGSISTYNLYNVVNPYSGQRNFQISGIPTSPAVTGATISFGTSSYSTSEQVIVY